MKVVKLDYETKELSRTLLADGYTTTIDCTRYWDAHGERIQLEPEQRNFDEPKKFEIVRVLTELVYPDSDSLLIEDWLLYVDGEKYDIGEIMKYRALKTKLELDVCVGRG